MRGKKWLLMFFIGCLLLQGITVAAADDQLGTVVDGSLLTEETEVKGIAQPIARGTYLGMGWGFLTINSGRNVNVSGTTSCNRTSDQVKVTIHLQQLSGGSWHTIRTVGPTVAYNTNFVSTSRDYNVTGGYYYRVSGTHTAIKGKTVETLSSYSDGIWIP